MTYSSPLPLSPSPSLLFRRHQERDPLQGEPREWRGAHTEPNVISPSAQLRAMTTCESDEQWQQWLQTLALLTKEFDVAIRRGDAAKDEPDVISYKCWDQGKQREAETKVEPNATSYSRLGPSSWRPGRRPHGEKPAAKAEPNAISYHRRGARRWGRPGEGQAQRHQQQCGDQGIEAPHCEKREAKVEPDLPCLCEQWEAKVEPNAISYHRRGTRRWRRRDEGRAQRPQLQSWDQGMEAPHCEKREANAAYLREVGGEEREGRAVAAGTARSGRQSWSQILYLVLLLLLLVVGKKWETKADPDVISYRAVISAGEKGEAKLEPSIVVYSAVPTVCDEGGQWQQALTLLNERWKAKQKPDAISYPPLHCEKWEAKLEPELVSNNVGNSVRATDGQGQQVQRVR